MTRISPVKMPAMCGTVRASPKFTPDVVSMMLLGPGVTELTKVKDTNAVSSGTVMVSGDMALGVRAHPRRG